MSLKKINIQKINYTYATIINEILWFFNILLTLYVLGLSMLFPYSINCDNEISICKVVTVRVKHSNNILSEFIKFENDIVGFYNLPYCTEIICI